VPLERCEVVLPKVPGIHFQQPDEYQEREQEEAEEMESNKGKGRVYRR
jgi:hypothetical protein